MTDTPAPPPFPKEFGDPLLAEHFDECVRSADRLAVRAEGEESLSRATLLAQVAQVQATTALALATWSRRR